jgi:hypothetical protein
MEPGKIELGPWSNQIITLFAAVFEKRLGHDRTDLVSARISVDVSTVPIA